MRTTIITATYNKAKYLGRAAQSVFDQIDTEWIWWIVLDGPDKSTEELATSLAKSNSKITLFNEPTTEDERRHIYRPAVIINKYYPLVETDYMSWFSDDDILEPCFLSLLRSELDKKEYEIAFGACEVVNSQLEHITWHREDTDIGFGTEILPCRRIDGCQILHTRKAYDYIKDRPLPILWDYGPCLDGYFMDMLAEKYTFKNMHKKVLTHCCTELSTWRKG